MRNFDEPRLHPVEAMRNDIDRLTVLRDLTSEPPLQTLVGLMDELLAEDWQPYNVSWAYHEMASAVLHAGAAAVTGDRWRDYILYAILQRDNLFSLSAAAGKRDEVLLAAMAADLQIMHQLFLLDDSILRHWCKELLRAGASGEEEGAFASWSASLPAADYGKGPIAQMRAHLNLSEDWGKVAPVLYDYFAKHGSGSFLGGKRFVWDGQALTADLYDAAARPPEEGTPGGLALKALQGGARCFAFVGPEGSGKLPALCGLAEADPATRVVFAEGVALSRLFALLAAQPLDFLLCFPSGAPRLTALERFRFPRNVRMVFIVTQSGDAPLPEDAAQADCVIRFAARGEAALYTAK